MSYAPISDDQISAMMQERQTIAANEAAAGTGRYWWRPKVGANYIRILPPAPGQQLYVRRDAHKMFKPRWADAPCLAPLGAACPVCDYLTTVPYDSGVDVKGYGARGTYLMNILVIMDDLRTIADNGQVWVFEAPPSIFKQIADIHAERDKRGDILDATHGHVCQINKPASFEGKNAYLVIPTVQVLPIPEGLNLHNLAEFQYTLSQEAKNKNMGFKSLVQSLVERPQTGAPPVAPQIRPAPQPAVPSYQAPPQATMVPQPPMPPPSAPPGPPPTYQPGTQPFSHGQPAYNTVQNPYVQAPEQFAYPNNPLPQPGPTAFSPAPQAAPAGVPNTAPQSFGAPAPQSRPDCFGKPQTKDIQWCSSCPHIRECQRTAMSESPF